MCIPSIEDKTKCIHTGLNLLKTPYGMYCSNQCGLAEAIFIDRFLKEADSSIVISSVTKKNVDKFIERMQIWIDNAAKHIKD